ncbi:MAG: sugar ABC transporter ATP-binding protein [Chloroflexota bacterium]
MTEPLLELIDIHKRFPGVRALSGVSFDMLPGEVHALIGENGAGKSTLIKIMSGVYRPDQGSMRLDGQPVQFANPREAQRHGIAVIYQEPMVFPDLNVAENIFISHQNLGMVVNWRRMYHDAEEILARIGVSLDSHSQARGLTLAEQQTVEIAKALSLNARVLIMDEPTASLSAHEVDQLFKLTRILRDRGVAVLFISHRMDEIFEIADRVTVFRDGQMISSKPIAEVNREVVIHEMVGRKLEAFFVRDEHPRGDLLMSVRGLTKENVFSDINFDLYQGEVLGFAGLVGARRTDVGLALFGVEPSDSGEILLDGAAQKIRSPEQALDLGIAYVTEDRRLLGLTLTMSITANISLPSLSNYLTPLGIVRRKQEQATAEDYRQRLSIRAPSIRQEAGKLSGGNQQKVVLSKWLNIHPRLLILDEPTRGIDVGAKAEVHHIINDLAAQGMCIMLISSDLPEVLAMSDRILVMREGRQINIFNRDEATQEVVINAAMGQ